MNITYAIEFLQDELARVYGKHAGDKPVLVDLTRIATQADALLEDKAGTENVKFGATRAEVALVDLLNGILLISKQRGFRIGRTLSLALNDLEQAVETKENNDGVDREKSEENSGTD